MRPPCPTDRPTPAARRRGAVAVAVIVCLLVLMMIGGTLLRTSLTERRLIEDQERRLPAEWVAQAGLGSAPGRASASRGHTRGTGEPSPRQPTPPPPRGAAD